MTKTEFVDQVASASGLAKSDATKAVDAVLTTIEDTLNPNSRVKLEEYPGYLFMIIRGVRFFEETNDPYDLETFNLNFFLGSNYLVTVHGGQSLAIGDEIVNRIPREP